MNKSQATQTIKRSNSEEDSLDTFSLLNETWVTDPDADDEAEPEKLEQAIGKAEKELKELQENFSKMKCLKGSTNNKTCQLSLKERLKCSMRLKCKTKDRETVMNKSVQGCRNSESQSVRSSVGQAIMRTVRNERRRPSQLASTSGPKYSSYLDSSDTEEIKRRESNIQEVIVKVESKIKDMRSILEKLIQTKAQQKREKIDKDLRKKNENNKEQVDVKNKPDVNLKLKDSKGKPESKKSKNESECPNREPRDRNLSRKSELNIRKSHEIDIKDKTSIKDKNRERPSTTKSVVENRERRSKSALSKCKRSHSGRSHGKESEKKGRSQAASADS